MRARLRNRSGFVLETNVPHEESPYSKMMLPSDRIIKMPRMTRPAFSKLKGSVVPDSLAYEVTEFHLKDVHVEGWENESIAYFEEM